MNADWLESRAAIQDIIVRYCMAMDRQDLDALDALLAEDVAFKGVDEALYKGKVAVRAYLARQFVVNGPHNLHIPSLPVISPIAPDRASSLHYAHWERPESGLLVVSAVTYSQEYARIDGEWRMSYRELSLAYSCQVGTLEKKSGITALQWGNEELAKRTPFAAEAWSALRIR